MNMHNKSEVPVYRREHESIEFCAIGMPVMQGSKSIVGRGKNAYMMDRADMKSKTMPSNRLKDWRELIAAQAAMAMSGQPWEGLVGVRARFVIQRPESHLRANGMIRKGKPLQPRGDLDKYLRAIGDALSGVVYKDDNQIVSFDGSYKRWGTLSGVDVQVVRL